MNYLYDGNNLLEDLDQSGNLLTRYTQGNEIDNSLAMLRSGISSYYHGDALGSISALSNSAGALANTYTYDSFGQLSAHTGTLTNPFQYTGRELDSETGLYYDRARYYDPTVGRFLSEDPIGFEGDNDFYRYVRDNPVNLSDPFGLQSAGTAPAPAPSPVKPPPDPITGPGPAPCAWCIPIIILFNPTELNGGEQEWIERQRERERQQCKSRTKHDKNDCMPRFLREKKFCERYYGTVLYGMCRDRAFWRFNNCQKGVADPGPLDPLDPNWSID